MTHRLNRRFVRRAAAIAVVAGLAVLVTSSASAHPSAAAKPKPKSPIHVLYVGSESGALAGVGNAFLHGAVAGAHIVNASGGVLGHKITLKIIDSGSDPAKAVQLLQQELASGVKYTAVEADNGVISGAISPIVAQHTNMLYTGASATPAQTLTACPNCYFSGPTQDTQVSGSIAYAKKKGYKSMAFFAADNASGRGYALYAKQEAAKYGLSYTEGFAPLGVIDATPQLQQLLAGKPDVLVIDGSGSSVALPARAKIGSSIPVICGQGCAGSTSWTTLTTGQRAGVTIMTLPFLVQNDPTTKTFAYKQYLKYLNPIDPTPRAFGLNAGITSYENMMLMRAAAKKCNCVDGARWAKELESVTSSKKVAGWIGPPTLFGPGIHSLIYPPTSYKAISANPFTPEGFWPAG